jgi:hypothetical protein
MLITSSSRHKTQHIICVLIFSLVQLSIWYQVISDYCVWNLNTSNEIFTRSRQNPTGVVLDEISKYRFSPSAPVNDNQLILMADKIMTGYLQLSGYEPVRINLPFDAKNFEKGLPTWQLTYAGMIVPDILVDAYLLTRKDAYFRLAVNTILAWEKFEKAKWLPKGFLWNDHAIVSRIAVLSKFWSVYRARTDYMPETARSIFAMVERDGEMLVKDGQFTFATNHGVMQNLALLHLAAAFPEIPRVKEYRTIALKRLTDQMLFYINDEGVVLEHSAGYHSHGMELFGKAFRYLALNNMTPPPTWIEKYNRSKDFMSMIRRPDGSLPVFGNTNAAPHSPSFITEIDAKGGARPLFRTDNWRPITSHALYPVAGYSIWWDGLSTRSDILAQTVIAWSYFQGHGHKLADEMSLLVWADNQNWLTNVGYWPYGVPGREMADSWEGSNAPHLLREPADSARYTQLLDYMVNGRLAFSHLRRTGPDDFSVDRQVLHIDSNLWLILDHHSSKKVRRVSTTWTFFPNLILVRGALSGQFYAIKNNAKSCMSIFLSGKDKIEMETYKGSMQPFSGWVVFDNEARPAPSLVSEQESKDSWSLTTLSLKKNCNINHEESPKVINWQSSDRWEADIPLGDGALKILRTGKTLHIGSKSYLIGAELGDKYTNASIAIEQAKIADSFNFASKKYRKKRDIFSYRQWVTYLLGAAFLFQEIFFAILFAMPKQNVYFFRIACNGVWGVGGVGLHLLYFN